MRCWGTCLSESVYCEFHGDTKTKPRCKICKKNIRGRLRLARPLVLIYCTVNRTLFINLIYNLIYDVYLNTLSSEHRDHSLNFVKLLSG